jgi:DNA polymerase III delta prime subunit
MRRYATAPRSTFEEFFERARSGIVKLDASEYPPVCAERSGEVSLLLGRTGAMIVHVRPGECRAEEFRLKLLFETGSCVFTTPQDLCDFWTGPLAVAFGIEPAEPMAPPDPVAPEKPEGEIECDRGTKSLESILADLVPAKDPPNEGAAPGDLPTRAASPRRTKAAPNPPATAPSPPSEQRLTAARLADELSRVIYGQEPALERVASTTVAQLTKRHPARPGSVLLIGPTGVGKTATVEALPTALRALGFEGATVFRLDCGELTDSIQLTRLLGSPPGYSGHATTTPLLAALERPGCILLVDEIEKAHPDVLDLVLGLLDAGRLTGPAGQVIGASHIVVALTTSAASDELAGRLRKTPLEDRWAVQRACAEQLRASGLPADLVGRIGAFAAYGELQGEAARRGVAKAAIAALGREYGLLVGPIDPIVTEVVEDIARDSGAAGARALHHAARELLAESFAAFAADGPLVRVAIDAGPPVAVRITKGA